MLSLNNLIKYSILFIVVTLSTYMIPIKITSMLHIGLLGTTFVLRYFYPHTIIVHDKEKNDKKLN